MTKRLKISGIRVGMTPLRLLACVVLTGLAISSLQAQVGSTDSTTASGIAPGSPVGSYSLSGFENINPYNGNVNVRLPLLNGGGRGATAFTVPIVFNDKGWRVRKTYDRVNDDYRFSPTQYGWSGVIGYGPGSLMGRQVAVESAPSSCVRDAYGNPQPWPQYTLTRLTFTDQDNTEYELRDQATNGQPLYRTGCFTGASRGTVFVSVDGTAMTFVSDASIVDYVGTQSIAPSGYLMLRSGTRYRIDNGSVSWMRDRNGNTLNFSYDSNLRLATITDSLNRQVTIQYADGQSVFYDLILFKGFGGLQRTIRVDYTPMSNALRSDFAIQTMAQLFPELNGASSSAQYNPNVVSSVTLPNGLQYHFFYNSYGELARFELPTGGAIEYDMMPGSGVLQGGSDDFEIYRRVAERREYADGSTGATYSARTIYSATQSSPSDIKPWYTTVTVDHYNAGSTQVLAREIHYYYGSGAASLFKTDYRYDLYSAWREGREYKTELLDPGGAGTTVLRREESTLQQRAPVGWWIWSVDDSPPNDPRISNATTTLEPGGANLVAQKNFTYDDSVPFNNQSDVYEYDYGSGAAGSLLRRTHSDYVTTTQYVDAVSGAHLRSLPTQVSIYDGVGIERARTTFDYDNPAYALVDRPAISGLDSTYTASYITRGNVTSTTRFLLTNGSSVTTNLQYDIAGNVVSAIDGRGYATFLDYADRFGAPDGEARGNSVPTELSSQGQYSYAFATFVRNAQGQTSFAQFDYYLGRPVDSEDVNGVVSSVSYNDTLDRPSQVIRAANQGVGIKSQTTLTYNDPARIVTSTSDLNTYGDNTLKSEVVYDQLGRTSERRQYESGATYITNKQTYDAFGRVSQVSNPYRTGDTVVWTTTTYDALSRVISLTTPDSAVVTTSYSSNSVTVADQTGKARKSVTDALGRLVQVYEDPNGLNYVTSYSYDVLGDLTSVSQGAQSRTFAYDSLRRLTTAANPESGTTTYQYDANGNLTQRADARGVKATYSYDVLNRNTQINYSDGTPSSYHFYDGASNGIGRFWYSRAVTATRIDDRTVVSYDPLGRPLDERQSVYQSGSGWSPAYDTQRTYNLAGGVSSQTYPSGHAVTYTYDGAGRTQSLLGNLGNGIQRIYATGITYDSNGGWNHEQFGTTTPLFNKRHYNNREQLYDMRVSTVDDDMNWNRGAIVNYYSLVNFVGGGTGPDTNGNLYVQQHWIPTDDQISSYTIHRQNYAYDSLNRVSWVGEILNEATNTSAQNYSYDRYGNRTMTGWGTGINNQQFTIDPNTNRLGVPTGQLGTMTYDGAGNLIYDNYSGEGQSTYDAENRMISAADSYNRTSTYTYDGDGQRVARNVNGTETWHVYGFGGELLAEYAANASPLSPQKEYGYRNGQLLVTAEPNAGLHWLVTDQLGTPRMIFDDTGSLTSMSRHDYLPFGEELFAGTGGRTSAQGYTGDSNRQKWTTYERDSETSLDYARHRYYSSTQGRFTSPDPYGGSGFVSVPQSWNKYSYSLNRPFVFTDPSGLIWLTNDDVNFQWVADDEYKKNRDQWKDYREADGAIAQYSSSTGCPECKDYKPGSWVQLNANGHVSQVADPTTTIRAQYDEQVEDHQIYAQLGMTRTGGRGDGNPLSGPPGGSSHIDYENGGGQTRHYGQNGLPWVDIDYGHDHNGVGDPHVHWWDWNNPSDPRGEAEPLPWGWSMWDNGEYVPQPRGTSPMFPVYPMDVPMGVPFRPMVPLRPMIWEPVLVP